MPPVRWRGWFFVMTILVQTGFFTDAQQMQDTISMSSDGWRPILGSRRQTDKPGQGIEVVRANVLNIETTTIPLPESSLPAQKVPAKNSLVLNKSVKQGTNLKAPFKTTNSYFTITPSSPLSSVPMGARQQLKKSQALKKNSVAFVKYRKPIRGQALAHSSRNEIFAPPPPHQGTYSFVKSIPPNNIKIREAQGFGLVGGNFGQNIELNRFPLTGETFIQRPTFLYSKPMNDEYTRNLVPPPRLQQQQQQNKENIHKISLYAFKEGPPIDTTSGFYQFGSKPDHFAPQISPTFYFTGQQQQQQQKTQKAKEQTVEVQVTKENLKKFTQNEPASFVQPRPSTFSISGPTKNNFPIEYVDYDFHAPKPKPQQPNTLTYEVTEGKWLDTPSHQYQFRPQNYFLSQGTKIQNARPGLLFQTDVSSTRQPFIESPLVELNVPAFLPTPYRPDSTVEPTSPTQSDVSTVFNKVSIKMKKYKNDALKQNPLFYDIADVSTHYPILGTPQAESEGVTDSPTPINDNEELTNEITTSKEKPKPRLRHPTKEPTTTALSRDPTKSRITNRRRPKPKKPTTSKTTTTTTEETPTGNYGSVRSEETVDEISTEPQKVQRRRRPKPTLYRPREKNENEDEAPNKQRGRYRFKNRERPSAERSDTAPIQRKRLRPTNSENIMKETHNQFLEVTTESSNEQGQYVFENYPSHDSYSRSRSGNKEVNTQSQLSIESTQEEPSRQDNKPFIEEIHPVTEEIEIYEITRIPTQPTTEIESSTIFQVPENDIEFSTQVLPSSEKTKEDMEISTQSTTTTSEVSAMKSNRIRRPSKFNSSNRPRFSVKDYRHRLNQHTSTTPSSSTSPQSKNSTDGLKLRFPSRLRHRPTTASSRIDEDSTDEILTTMKSRFHPKEPRFQTTTDSNLIITEKNVVAVNTRLRPFGRTRLTTEATSAPKVSIRPNLFSAKRRSGYPSLKARIQNRLKKNDTDVIVESDESSTIQNELEGIESLKITESIPTDSTATTTDFSLNQINEDTTTDFDVQTTTGDIMKTDALLYSQRVSDLTSSFKDYDKPGIFNSVSPTSRSIPNYFTLSTDDPILPIEAFFPNLKEKEIP